VVEIGGYCYYLSKTGQSCTEACDQQMGGECDAAGTEYAAHSVDHCKSVMTEFGGLYAEAGVESENDRAGCTWSDEAEASKVDVMKQDGLYPLCSEIHAVRNSHRVCACTAMFGSQKVFNESAGECRNADGGQNKIRTGTFRSAQECEDECTRDSNCGAFAYVHP